jgi:hypothetical protein
MQRHADKAVMGDPGIFDDGNAHWTLQKLTRGNLHGWQAAARAGFALAPGRGP